jgi:hypothetical protein
LSIIIKEFIDRGRFAIKYACPERFVPMLRYLAFTDSDGPLVDSDTYSYERAMAATNPLKETGTSIIFCSAKQKVRAGIIPAPAFES